jgi:anti-anti-sigma regulatory factor
MLPPGAAPKLVIEKFADGGVACIKFVGTIDESFDGKKLGASAAADTLVIDLGGVKKISSFGIREWVDFVAAASKHARSMILIECTPKVMDQLNMVANFAGGGRVFSFYAPFRCDYCDTEHMVLQQIDRDFEAIRSMKLAERPCLACKESMYFDEDGATFFSYLIGQDRFQLEPAVEAFLASKLNYAVSDLNRKLRVDKVIEGRTTYLRLNGDLDATFPRDKLAEGLEGIVIVDLGAIGKIEPAGAVEWRGFLTQVSLIAEQVYLAAAPPAFIEKLCTRDDVHPKVELVTALMPYTCPSCGTTSAHNVDLGVHYDVIKLATPPELRCPACKHVMQCHVGEAVMTLLPNLPRPTASPELVKSIGMLRERAIAAGTPGRRPPQSVASAASQAIAPRSSIAVAVLSALIAIAVAGGGYLAYQRVASRIAPGGRGEITARSADQRPAWIASDTPAFASCSEVAGKGLSCVGVSSISARQDDAEDESADAAFDAVANAIAVRIGDARWKQNVLPVYAAARGAKLAAFDRDPSNTTARREVREARHAVAQALRATGGGAVPPAPTGRYWEEYQSPDGKRYLAFAQVALGATELGKLAESYSHSARALGATAVSMFPLIAWRYPKLERGAVVVALTTGPLQDLGLAEQYVVLAFGGRDVNDAAGFAKLAGDEYAGLIAHGGTLRLKVQAADGAPREFATAITPPRADSPAGDPVKRPYAPTAEPTGVNVWDRYGRSSRDDPTQ